MYKIIRWFWKLSKDIEQKIMNHIFLKSPDVGL